MHRGFRLQMQQAAMHGKPCQRDPRTWYTTVSVDTKQCLRRDLNGSRLVMQLTVVPPFAGLTGTFALFQLRRPRWGTMARRPWTGRRALQPGARHNGAPRRPAPPVRQRTCVCLADSRARAASGSHIARSAGVGHVTRPASSLLAALFQQIATVVGS